MGGWSEITSKTVIRSVLTCLDELVSLALQGRRSLLGTSDTPPAIVAIDSI
jgi:hypothetical protein